MDQSQRGRVPRRASTPGTYGPGGPPMSSAVLGGGERRGKGRDPSAEAQYNLASPPPRGDFLVHAPPISGPRLTPTPDHVIPPPCCPLLIGVGPRHILRRSCPRRRQTRCSRLIVSVEGPRDRSLPRTAPEYKGDRTPGSYHSVGHMLTSRPRAPYLGSKPECDRAQLRAEIRVQATHKSRTGSVRNTHLAPTCGPGGVPGSLPSAPVCSSNEVGTCTMPEPVHSGSVRALSPARGRHLWVMQDAMR
ncbi:hypothetical protein PYCCODRAFT_1130331 [Trametes coccinea BRFM310]|uniref:Uncharacterized protein n=1 Tax=Trametes coccinea (strain BRFM310) TaxID=1353009 RepID=A0A1Y2I8Q2_TRAC3|nr:hypothetical protein PYCCODRAFT_1130331 [Trametes coccinea BRFM310]